MGGGGVPLITSVASPASRVRTVQRSSARVGVARAAELLHVDHRIGFAGENARTRGEHGGGARRECVVLGERGGVRRAVDRATARAGARVRA